ncbi:hypothetical protein FISHEDRAFT_55973 [Fistulina hepatica ATCC 64428]|uniref:Uncharacterized protein n=1 Tax=Fistulina hepatica ATCC 64428 TaxID=1128425 RepID=A0A0D7ANX2_9AGAR|nr:hypothetical protein FISHEDRAFT_55973 [Fistulina hepatica ATCC 64428]
MAAIYVGNMMNDSNMIYLGTTNGFVKPLNHCITSPGLQVPQFFRTVRCFEPTHVAKRQSQLLRADSLGPRRGGLEPELSSSMTRIQAYLLSILRQLVPTVTQWSALPRGYGSRLPVVQLAPEYVHLNSDIPLALRNILQHLGHYLLPAIVRFAQQSATVRRRRIS